MHKNPKNYRESMSKAKLFKKNSLYESIFYIKYEWHSFTENQKIYEKLLFFRLTYFIKNQNLSGLLRYLAS